jgi:hypothetical protein
MQDQPENRTAPSADGVALAGVMRAGADAGQPTPLFDAVEQALGQIIGHKLFTLLQVHPGGELERVYTNMPDSYPVAGRKKMGPTPWGKHVIEGQKPYLGRNAEDIRWAFFDHELIESLGCRSVINVLIQWDGRLLGTINMLHEENFYDEADLDRARPFAQALVPAFLTQGDGD